MKVYEIGLPDHYDDDSNDGCDCTLWIASEHEIKLAPNPDNEQAYVKEVDAFKNIDKRKKGWFSSVGIDFVVE